MLDGEIGQAGEDEGLAELRKSNWKGGELVPRSSAREGRRADVVMSVGSVADDGHVVVVGPLERLSRLLLTLGDTSEDSPGLAGPADLPVGSRDENLLVGVIKVPSSSEGHLVGEVVEGERTGSVGRLKGSGGHVEEFGEFRHGS